MKAARRIERIDLYLKFGIPVDAILFEVNRLQNRIVKTELTYDQDAIPRLGEMLSGERVPTPTPSVLSSSWWTSEEGSQGRWKQGDGFLYGIFMIFDEEARKHSFAFKCIPVNTLRQMILSLQVVVIPDVLCTRSMDGFGNTVLKGTIVGGLQS